MRAYRLNYLWLPAIWSRKTVKPSQHAKIVSPLPEVSWWFFPESRWAMNCLNERITFARIQNPLLLLVICNHTSSNFVFPCWWFCSFSYCYANKKKLLLYISVTHWLKKMDSGPHAKRTSLLKRRQYLLNPIFVLRFLLYPFFPLRNKYGEA